LFGSYSLIISCFEIARSVRRPSVKVVDQRGEGSLALCLDERGGRVGAVQKIEAGDIARGIHIAKHVIGMILVEVRQDFVVKAPFFDCSRIFYHVVYICSRDWFGSPRVVFV